MSRNPWQPIAFLLAAGGARGRRNNKEMSSRSHGITETQLSPFSSPCLRASVVIRRWGVLMLGAFLFLAAVPGAFGQLAPQDRGIGDCEDGYIEGGIVFYDTSGSAGIAVPDNSVYHGGWYFETERGYRVQSSWDFSSRGFARMAPDGLACTGDAYYYEVYTGIPEVGTVSGMWAVDAFYPYGYVPRIIYPIPGEWGGMKLPEQAADSSTMMQMNVFAMVADSKTKPSLGARVESVFDLEDRPMSLIVEYLPGNAAETVTSETVHWDGAITSFGWCWINVTVPRRPCPFSVSVSQRPYHLLLPL